jgi:hypothetical protein
MRYMLNQVRDQKAAKGGSDLGDTIEMVAAATALAANKP